MKARLLGVVRRPWVRSLAVLFALAVWVTSFNSACGQVCCARCPDNAGGVIAGLSCTIYDEQGRNVIGGTVDASQTLVLPEVLVYEPFALDLHGNLVTAAGFTGGRAFIKLPDGTLVDVTPDDLATTVISDPATSPGCPGAVPFKPMKVLRYTPTLADVAAGYATFTFIYRNGLALLPNAKGECKLRVFASCQATVSIAESPAQPVPLFGTRVNEGYFEFSFQTVTNRAYVVEWTDGLSPVRWWVVTNLAGHGSVATVPVGMTSTQRFYRVLVQ